MTIKETIDRFNSLYELNKQPGEEKKNYCCGTSVEMSDYGNMYIAITQCDSVGTIKLLLGELEKDGYTVESARNDGALYVYMKRCNVLREKH